MDKFSTASTGTAVLTNSATTWTIDGGAATWDNLFWFRIPIGWQRSKLEASIKGYGASSGAAVFYIVPGRRAPDNIVNYVGSLTINSATTMTASTTFSCIGGESFWVLGYTATTFAKYGWDFKLAGTSTSLSTGQNWADFAASMTATPTSTG